MATGLEMFDALRRAAGRLPRGARLGINADDADDLKQLDADDLARLGMDRDLARRIVGELALNRFEALSARLGVAVVRDDQARNLIPGEGLRRAAEIMKDDPQSLEEMLEELDRIRHPERYPA